MKNRPLTIASIAAIAVIIAWAVLFNLWVKSDRRTTPARPVESGALSVDALAQSIRDEAPVEKLSVREVEGIVIIRGKTRQQNVVERVSQLARERGFARVANLIQVTPAPDDETIEREAERALAQNRALDGCRFSIDSSDGIVTVSGVVQQELQKDLARDLLRRVPGVREVRADLRRL